jgi:hypothetical protein
MDDYLVAVDALLALAGEIDAECSRFGQYEGYQKFGTDAIERIKAEVRILISLSIAHAIVADRRQRTS